MKIKTLLTILFFLSLIFNLYQNKQFKELQNDFFNLQICIIENIPLD